MNAGQLGRIDKAKAIVKRAMSLGVRPVDIMIGLIAPLLSAIGEQWDSGETCVAEEHRFTAFCEDVFDLLRNESKSGERTSHDDASVLLLLNADGNNHTLGVRILAMWLWSKGFDVRIQAPTPSSDELLLLCRTLRPIAVLISLALAEQRPGVLGIIEGLASYPVAKPVVIVGGYAVKMNLVPPISGAHFATDLTDLDHFLRNLGPETQFAPQP